VTYPFFMSTKASDCETYGIFAATILVKIDLKAGDVVNSEGYRIEARRAIKAGESIRPSILCPNDVG